MSEYLKNRRVIYKNNERIVNNNEKNIKLVILNYF